MTSPLLPHLILGLFGAGAWLVILAHASRAPAKRLWPPRRATLWTVVWSWGLTIAIYVGLIRLGLAEGNALGLSDGLRFGIGLPITVAGSVLQSWGTAALGLRATSGWPKGADTPDMASTKGPYCFTAHPQYIGQSMSFVGIALASGGIWVWVVAVAGCFALLRAAQVEDVHLRRSDF
ncbi:methyltransferase family protein [Celeribacter sp.]|uniref:methyltransferase family protein n=1 Tax=Celeribacter sp. TaxID=1890673 RepID=UPI003A9354B4